MEIMLRLGVLTIWMYPDLDWVAIVRPLGEPVTLSLAEFEAAVTVARRRL